jgi:hypothetical protein
MAQEERIEAGNYVTVYFQDGEVWSGMQVLYTPQDTGDMFHLRDIQGNGALIYLNPNSSALIFIKKEYGRCV